MKIDLFQPKIGRIQLNNIQKIVGKQKRNGSFKSFKKASQKKIAAFKKKLKIQNPFVKSLLTQLGVGVTNASIMKSPNNRARAGSSLPSSPKNIYQKKMAKSIK